MNYRKLHPWKYQLVAPLSVKTDIRIRRKIETEFITLLPSGMLTMSKYYSWYGATGAIDIKTFMRGSLAHDALLQLIASGLLEDRHRECVDKILHSIIIEDGMWRAGAWWVYKAVRLYGFIFH